MRRRWSTRNGRRKMMNEVTRHLLNVVGFHYWRGDLYETLHCVDTLRKIGVDEASIRHAVADWIGAESINVEEWERTVGKPEVSAR